MLKKISRALALPAAALLAAMILSSCGGDNFYSLTKDRLKTAKSEQDSEAVFVIVSDVFDNAIQEGNNKVDISSLSADRIGTRIQRSVFTGFDKAGMLPHVDVKLSVDEFELSEQTAQAEISVSFEMGGEQHEKSGTASFEKSGDSWSINDFEYGE